MFKRNHLAIGLVFLAILLVRVCPVIVKYSNVSSQTIIGADIDPLVYLDGARAILGEESKTGNPLTYYPPFNFIFISAFLYYGNNNILYPSIANAVIGWLTVVVMYCLARTLFNSKTALLAAIIAGIYPNLVFFGMTLYSENIAIFFLVSFFYMIVQFMQKRHFSYLAFAGVLLGITAITRGGTHYFSLLVAVYLIYALRKTGLSVGLKAAGFLIFSLYGFIAGAGYLLSPWTGGVSLDAKNGIATALHGTNRLVNPCSDYGNLNEVFFTINASGEKWPPGTLIYKDEMSQKKSFEMYLAILKYVREDPWSYIKKGLERIGFMWSPNQYIIHYIKTRLYESKPSATSWISFFCIVFYLAVVCGAFLGLVISKDYLRSLFLLFFLFSCGLVFVANGNTRYRLPCMPFIIIYFAYFAAHARTVLPSCNRIMAYVLILPFAGLFLGNSAYRYIEDIRYSPAEACIRRIEYCNNLGFPVTALFISRNRNQRNLDETLKKRFAAAVEKAQALIKVREDS